VPSSSRPRKSGAMSSIVEQGIANVERLEATLSNSELTEIATDYLCENRHNPRRSISEASVTEMVNGIRQAGGVILQALLVRSIPLTEEGYRYEVICGNRRLRGARALGLPTVPVRLWDIDDETAARYALWENLARENLNPMDLAESINDLRVIDHLSWDEIGERFGFTRQWGWKQQKLAELSESIRELVREGKLAPSKAMLLWSLEEESQRLTLAQQIVEQNLSHREAETLIRQPEELPCKHVLTYTPPKGFSTRRYGSVFKAAHALANSLSRESIPPDIALSMREIAQELLLLAEQKGAS
jgi:ParB family transcriptional regulator, chromosome partitioning protein